jgi:hypothetical protein
LGWKRKGERRWRWTVRRGGGREGGKEGRVQWRASRPARPAAVWSRRRGGGREGGREAGGTVARRVVTAVVIPARQAERE